MMNQRSDIMAIEEILNYLRKHKMFQAAVHVQGIADKYKLRDTTNDTRNDQPGEGVIPSRWTS